jgi:hypothetical protein
MSQQSQRELLNDEINIRKMFRHLKKSIIRAEYAASLGAESARLTLQLSSPRKKRSSTAAAVAREARVAEIDVEYDRVMKDGIDHEPAEHNIIINSPIKRRKATSTTILSPEIFGAAASPDAIEMESPMQNSILNASSLR